jgi:hypothetical protein
MSRIPLDFQRRCDRRWAARFAQPVSRTASRKQGLERKGAQIAEPDKRTKTGAELKRPA